jgi:hypothetical protein
MSFARQMGSSIDIMTAQRDQNKAATVFGRRAQLSQVLFVDRGPFFAQEISARPARRRETPITRFRLDEAVVLVTFVMMECRVA